MVQLSLSKAQHRLGQIMLLQLCFRSFSVMSSEGLNIAVITGTTRKEGPPRPILGPRVASFITKSLEERGNTCNLVDPNDFQLLEKPQFCYSKSQVPPKLKAVHELLQEADCYVCITPEYNHAPSPGLLNVLNHFGSSTFSFKPSAIVSYSAGQWGGTRAAIGLRPILSELGCLPVSAMIHLPNTQDIIDDHGNPIADEERWRKYTDRCFSQLEWWAKATKNQKKIDDPFQESPSFQTNPKERNAPTAIK